MFNNDEIIRQELDSLKDDIIQAYRQSGKKVSGQFEEGLDIREETNRWLLSGFGYLAGRKAGDMPVVQEILAWVKARGLRPFIRSMTVSQLAWAIAKSIAAKGTNEEYHFKIYEKVVTPERMQRILDRITSINITAFVDEVTTEMKLLTKEL